MASALTMIASVRHVWDMHRPHYECQCKTMFGTWHRRRDECQCKTCLGHASTESCASVRHVWDMHQQVYTRASVRPCLGHGISLDDDSQCNTMFNFKDYESDLIRKV
ncbi:Uncharacterized protein F383_13468 [Gossypium arboreum]|uniref:Uncharacterized protein n=1 Tax=Gossypium arboreum TaxID=29729 RepID=A0A0B0PXJ7_GOSAR|nr:Uncharacterized protein F383_13468 [Gossypium arboreum]